MNKKTIYRYYYDPDLKLYLEHIGNCNKELVYDMPGGNSIWYDKEVSERLIEVSELEWIIMG